MNKRLKTETGELLFEKHGHKWALTSFSFNLYEKLGVDKSQNSYNGNEFFKPLAEKALSWNILSSNQRFAVCLRCRKLS